MRADLSPDSAFMAGGFFAFAAIALLVVAACIGGYLGAKAEQRGGLFIAPTPEETRAD